MSARIIRLFFFKQSPINYFAVLAYGPIYIGRGTPRALQMWDTSRKEGHPECGTLWLLWVSEKIASVTRGYMPLENRYLHRCINPNRVVHQFLDQ